VLLLKTEFHFPVRLAPSILEKALVAFQIASHVLLSHFAIQLGRLYPTNALYFLERRNTAELTGAKFVLQVHLADGRVTRHASAHN
jgi:hypothetical protein